MTNHILQTHLYSNLTKVAILTSLKFRNTDCVERVLITVQIKLTAPKLKKIPAKWRLKIAKSTMSSLFQEIHFSETSVKYFFHY